MVADKVIIESLKSRCSEGERKLGSELFLISTIRITLLKEKVNSIFDSREVNQSS